jgi:hypothetical protein
MAGLQNDTSEIRAWLASHLKLEDIPETIWDDLVEEEYVKDAQNLGLPDGREKLLRQARRLMNAYRAGAGAGPAPKRKQPTGKRQKATAKARSEVVAEIKSKISEAKASSSLDASPNGDSARTESPITGMIANNRITVTADPWVSWEDWRDKIESLRSIWPWKQTPSARRVELVRFVTGFCDGYYNEVGHITGLLQGPNWPAWRHIMEQWNQRYPQEHPWHYTDHRNVRRDFRETFEALTLFENF